MSDGEIINDNDEVELDRDGRVILGDTDGQPCCFQDNMSCSPCCFGDTMDMTFDTLSQGPGYGSADPIVQAAVDWMIANWSASTISADKFADNFPTCDGYRWMICSTVVYTNATYAYFVSIRVQASMSGFSFICTIDRTPVGSYTVGSTVPIDWSYAGAYVLATTKNAGCISGYTTADCCGGEWGSGSIRVWTYQSSNYVLLGSTGLNGIVQFDPNSTGPCDMCCSGLETCYQIAGYVDGDLISCRVCSSGLSFPAWDGTFSENTPNECIWRIASGSKSINGKSISTNYSFVMRQCDVWVLQITCDDGKVDPCLVWYGTRAISADPTGTYTKVCGLSDVETLTIEACP